MLRALLLKKKIVINHSQTKKRRKKPYQRHYKRQDQEKLKAGWLPIRYAKDVRAPEARLIWVSSLSLFPHMS